MNSTTAGDRTKPEQISLRQGSVQILLLSVLLSFLFLGLKPFSTRGEPREALVAQSMVASGDFLVGSGYGGAVPSKPPFMHWIITGLSSVTGDVTEFTARFPSALFSTIFVLLFFRFLYSRIGPQRAFLSVLILLTSLEWLRASSTTRVDMTLAALTGMGLLAFFGWYERALKGIPWWAIVCFAAATLTKGPVAIILPGAIVGAFLLWERIPFLQIIRAGLVLFAPVVVLAGLWYLAAYLTRGEEFFHRFYYENVARFSSTQDDEPHKHSVLYLFGTLLLGFIPWTILLLPDIARVKRNAAATMDAVKRSSWARFSICAIVLFIVFFSIPSSKRSVYLLPIYPFIAVALSALLKDGNRWTREMVRVFSGLILLIILAGGAIVSRGPAVLDLLGRWGKGVDFGYLNLLLQPNYTPFTIGFLVSSLLVATCVWGIFATPQKSTQLGLFLVALLTTLQGSFLTSAADATSSRPFSTQLAPHLTTDSKVFSYGDEFYGVSFYLKRPIQSLGENAPPKDAIVILEKRNTEKLQKLLTPNQKLEFVESSPNAIDRIGSYVVALQVTEGTSP